MKKTSIPLLFTVFLAIFVSGHVPVRGKSVSCGYHPLVADSLSSSDIHSWLYWVETLSGERPIEMDGFPYSIRTRNTRYMFDGSPDARAYDYVLQQVKNWFPESAIIEQPYGYVELTAKNIIVTIPGSTKPDEYVLLVAHLDDTAWNSLRIAPGANDNAIGAATLLEVARLFRQLNFERSVRLIWFTGEEAGTIGSRMYVGDYGDLDYRGVLNLDMFGWDGDRDRCFEIHVGSLPESDAIGRCLVESIQSYNHDLSYDYLITHATGNSDHVQFWLQDIGAIAITENASEFGTENGCIGVDMNPNYHTRDDTIQLNLTPEFAYDIARAAMETIASLAVSIALDPSPDMPNLTILETTPEWVSLNWTIVPQAQYYRVFRASFGCQDWGVKIAETTFPGWIDETVRSDWPYQYRVEAVLPDGITVSPPSNCVTVGPVALPNYHFSFFPIISR
jgi:leucyl aminopeptidase